MRLLLISLSCLSFSYAACEEIDSEPSQLQVSLVSEEKSIQPGHPFWVVVQLQIQENWHSYWKNPGDAGMATAIEWELPNGFKASPIVWPTPKKFSVDSIIGYGYEGKVLLLTQITPPDTLATGKSVEIGAKVRWLVCSDSACLPGESETKTELPVLDQIAQISRETSSLFSQARMQLPKKLSGIQAFRHDDRIEMQLPLQKENITDVDFYPEDKHVIDHSAQVIITPSPDSPKQYTVSLKQSPSKPQSQAASLKGILVVAGDQNEPSHAIELNAPIHNSGYSEDYIGMAEDRPDPNQEEYNISPEEPVKFEGGLGMALIFAFIGGMILNLMPCVLPVISLKIFSFVKMAGQNRSLTLKHGLAFASGVIVSFWVLASALLMLKVYGHSVGWGFQLQEPIFVGILAAIMLMLGLSLFGVFEFGNSLTSLAGKAQGSAKAEGLTSSFLSGILATAVATPCTGPFLGSAVGFAFTVPAFQALLVFTVLGIGMSFPYVLLAAFPNLLRYLPKPGPWMITFKEIMGFLMLATVLWLVWVFGAQTTSFAVLILLAAFFSLSVGCWIYGKWGSPVKSRLSRTISSIIAILCVATAGYAIFISSQAVAIDNQQETTQVSTSWEKFSPTKVIDLQKQGRPVLVDFTAKWCLICQVNHLVLSSSDVDSKLAEMGAVKMKADWTKNDPEITEELRKYGRNSVPLYLLYSGKPNEPPQILPQVLTPEIVKEYLESIK
jgi:thiol:disulfide interchange protein